MQAAFFDLDKTVIARASMVAFGGAFYREGLISRWLVLRALYGQLVYLYIGASDARLARMRRSALALTKGWHQDHVQRIVREALAEVIEPIVYDEALELIRQHQSEGRRVYIVSASPQEIVRPLAEFLGVDDAIATRARIDEDGRYSGELEFYSYGPLKADAMRELAEQEGIDLAESYAYSDSATDIPMLEVVGHPVAVNPDRALLKMARQQEWEVRWFVRPVRLRDRVPMPSPRQTAVGGGVMATAAAAAVVWWWVRRQPDEPPPTVRQRVLAAIRRRGPSWPRRRRGR